MPVPLRRGAGAWEEPGALGELPPRCPSCGGLARPGVVTAVLRTAFSTAGGLPWWSSRFGEAIPPEALRAAAEAVDCDLFLAVGTSSVVYPAAGLLLEARERGAWTVEINPDATAATGDVDLALAGPAEAVLDRVEARLGARPGRE